jgi:hypothetical protein
MQQGSVFVELTDLIDLIDLALLGSVTGEMYVESIDFIDLINFALWGMIPGVVHINLIDLIDLGSSGVCHFQVDLIDLALECRFGRLSEGALKFKRPYIQSFRVTWYTAELQANRAPCAYAAVVCGCISTHPAAGGVVTPASSQHSALRNAKPNNQTSTPSLGKSRWSQLLLVPDAFPPSP